MKKHMYLGVNGDSCCILSCLLPFDMLVADELEVSDFTYGATSWNGRDNICRTVELRNLVPTGRILKLPRPIVFTGYDNDMGHTYHWSFAVHEIHEVA